MSETVSHGLRDGQPADSLATIGQVPVAGAVRGSRGRGRRVALGIVAAIAAGVLSAWAAGAFSRAASTSPGGSSAVGTAPVVRTTLTTTVQDGGSIGYSGSYTITAPPPGSGSQAASDQQAVTADQQTTTEAQQTMSDDEQAESDTTATGDQTVAADEANVSTDRSALTMEEAKEAEDCAVTSSAATGPDTAACTADEQQVSGDQSTLTTARQKLAADQLAAKTAGDQAQAKVASDKVALQGDQAKLADDQAALASLQATQANPGTTYTWLPGVGEVIRQDQRAYSVSGEPVPLLYGAIPAYRAFYPGMSDGGDVSELTRDLIGLGYGDGLAQSDHYSQATAAAVRRWQQALGLPATGEILLGEVAFEPGPIRVTTVTPSTGAPVSSSGSGTVLTATGITPIVTVDLAVTQEDLVRPGDAVSVVLPDGTTTVGGRVESVGTVATCPGGGTTGTGSADQSPCSTAGSGTDTTPEVTVTITLDSIPPQATLDQAPVNVNITEYRVVNVLAVPVGALLAQQSGGYAVEVVGAGNARRLVPVTVGLLDDASGLAQVTGNLTPGEQVVEAGS